jgi:hypothetical protein
VALRLRLIHTLFTGYPVILPRASSSSSGPAFDDPGSIEILPLFHAGSTAEDRCRLWTGFGTNRLDQQGIPRQAAYGHDGARIRDTFACRLEALIRRSARSRRGHKFWHRYRITAPRKWRRLQVSGKGAGRSPSGNLEHAWPCPRDLPGLESLKSRTLPSLNAALFAQAVFESGVLY